MRRNATLARGSPLGVALRPSRGERRSPGILLIVRRKGRDGFGEEYRSLDDPVIDDNTLDEVGYDGVKGFWDGFMGYTDPSRGTESSSPTTR
jgi:hypothetical protein